MPKFNVPTPPSSNKKLQPVLIASALVASYVGVRYFLFSEQKREETLESLEEAAMLAEELVPSVPLGQHGGRGLKAAVCPCQREKR